MNINLELYKVFCEVVKYQNISKAAEQMYISQSAVTQSIQKLENMLGGKLFFRSKIGVELTEEGKNLYDYIKDSIETMSNAENIFSNYVNLEKGKIRINGGNTLLYALIMPSLIDFMKDYPNIDVSITNYSSEQGLQKLANGEIDMVALNLAHTIRRYSNIEMTELKFEPNYCFFASKTYLEKHPIKNIKELESHKLILPKSPIIKQQVEEYTQEKNIKLHTSYEVANSSLIKTLILNDLGVGYSNIENVREIIDSGEAIVIENIKSKSENDIQCIATLKKNMCSKATIELIKRIKKKFE